MEGPRVLSTPTQVKEASWAPCLAWPSPECVRVFVFTLTKPCQAASVQRDEPTVRVVGAARSPLGPVWALLPLKSPCFRPFGWTLTTSLPVLVLKYR